MLSQSEKMERYFEEAAFRYMRLSEVEKVVKDCVSVLAAFADGRWRG